MDKHASPKEKIALFRSLFRGREDVYPRRFESRKTGKSGYQPVCGNLWVRGVCGKPSMKCSAYSNQRYLPITDEVVSHHLSGRDEAGQDFVMGIYPMLLDETCFFLAIDFDKAEWQEDVRAVMDTCHRFELPAYLEGSRSGAGGHVWLFFEEAVPAVLARKLGAYILTETLDHRPGIGLDSYDRFFPNQDTLPRGGFGNLIALPLQKTPREKGNSVFLDEEFNPWPDPWAFLSSIQRVYRVTLENLVQLAERKNRVMSVGFPVSEDADDTPWTAPPSRKRKEPPLVGPLPKKMELVLGNEIYIEKEGLHPGLRNRLLQTAAFQNPEFCKAQAMRLPTYGTPRIIDCAEEHPKHFGLPRGCMESVQKLLSSLKIKTVVRDERFIGVPIELSFCGTLRPDQKRAVDSLMEHDTGVLSATTAFGKTVVAAWMIAQRGVNTLILVHRQQLQEQWIERLSSFLGISVKSIGRIGGGPKKPNGTIDVALIQSMVRKGVVDDRVGDYGHLIVDECHHLPAASFEQVARRTKAKYILGLSATVTRKDGHHPVITMQCGPIRYRTDAKQQAKVRPFIHTVVVRPTPFQMPPTDEEDRRIQFHEHYEALIADEARNRMIIEDALAVVQEGRSPVILTERTEHLDWLHENLVSKVEHLIVLKGGMGKKKLTEALEKLSSIPSHESRILLATGRFLGEGFDDARLDTLLLTLPVSWRGTIAQYAGRLHRLYDSKKEVRIYDYADLNEPMLARMFDRRCKGYEAVGYTIILPASAVPGWPQDVPLPMDPNWKKDYAASIRRLVRDGVDTPLADLFVHAARNVEPNAKGVERARSASEAFLYRRLESLSQTSGRFQLNHILPIPFDGFGNMEVDLLCLEAHLAIEVDGPQHLSDLEAYRRDRRKDALLQENGYFVLRFLAEDVGKRLGSYP